ncbi:hypothetical protein PGT21_010057 [Puccinia graminis f. sp. tritici]|uniref:Peptidase A2 domain-containing protein n=1 Tax=Puccinia graminis f. sp. tritici TaxID=56615 RepID=A0A5B0NMY4_PUCGR|nr:hypothetical protein PGTUg99_019808 [Puccinia graminis f. sp. tritici]KAA1090671.1 hypothetical protein PGT21_010057 [Puccinia graminis f. sp. tritici]
MADNEGEAAMVKIKPQNKALAFNGSNVERFLSQYQLAARLDGASEKDMAQQLGFFIAKDKLLDVVETLEGYEPPDWPKLKASMIAYWGNVDTAKFTSRDLESLVEEWKSKGGISSVVDYQEFRKTWEPIQSYLLAKAHIDSVEEIRKWYYQSFSTGVQERIRDQLIRDKTMITTLDKRFKLPTFEVLKNAVEEVMKGQTALTFEDSRSTVPVPSTLFKDSNDVMKKMEADWRPKEVSDASKPPATIDEISKMLQLFEQRLKKELSTLQASQTTPSGSRPPMVCYYCHYEGHGTGRCQKLQEEKENKLVEQQGNNFFLPNGALIPFDRTRPIRHVVASYQPPRPSTSFVSTEFKASCSTLQPWYPPAVSSQSFSGAYKSDPARKRHDEPKPYKAPSVPPSQTRRPIRKPSTVSPRPEKDEMEVEPELFERGPAEPSHTEVPSNDPVSPLPPSNDPVPPLSPSNDPVSPLPPSKPASSQPKVRFERGVTKEHPNAVDGVLKKISDLRVPDISVSELMAIAPSIAEGMKKWVSRRRVEVGPDELKVSSGTLVEGFEVREQVYDPKLYSCPLGYLPCLIGDEDSSASPLVDSGSQLNLISDALANKFNISPRVNFSSAVYGIGNQACELVGVAEDVPIRVGRNIVGTCHFWITRLDGPLILGRPFLIDFDATLLFSAQVGERILLPDASGRKIEVSLCPVDSGQWQREFPGQGWKAVLTNKGKTREDPDSERHFL